jgi:hypothetical protein
MKSADSDGFLKQIQTDDGGGFRRMKNAPACRQAKQFPK